MQMFTLNDTLLENQDVELIEGYDPQQLEPAPDDMVMISNTMKGNPCVEAVLKRIPLTLQGHNGYMTMYFA